MNTYTFFYFDSIDSFNSYASINFVVTASRFSVAFRAFYDFVEKSNFDYFTFKNVYKVDSRYNTFLRVLPSKYYYILDSLRKIAQ